MCKMWNICKNHCKITFFAVIHISRLCLSSQMTRGAHMAFSKVELVSTRRNRIAQKTQNVNRPLQWCFENI